MADRILEIRRVYLELERSLGSGAIPPWESFLWELGDLPPESFIHSFTETHRNITIDRHKLNALYAQTRSNAGSESIFSSDSGIVSHGSSFGIDSCGVSQDSSSSTVNHDLSSSGSAASAIIEENETSLKKDLCTQSNLQLSALCSIGTAEQASLSTANGASLENHGSVVTSCPGIGRGKQLQAAQLTAMSTPCAGAGRAKILAQMVRTVR